MTLDEGSNTDRTGCGTNGGIPNGKRDSDSSNGDPDATLGLRELMDSLPQELYDQIYDLTFTAESKIRIYSGRDMDGALEQGLAELGRACFQHVVKLNEAIPRLLHVDRTSRKKFAESYFGHPDSIFVFYFGHSPGMCIESTHLRLMNDMRVGEKWDVNSMCIYLDHESRSTHQSFLQVDMDDIVALVKARAGAAGEGACECIVPAVEASDGSASRSSPSCNITWGWGSLQKASSPSTTAKTRRRW